MKWTAGSTSRSPQVIVCLSSVLDDLIMGSVLRGPEGQGQRQRRDDPRDNPGPLLGLNIQPHIQPPKLMIILLRPRHLRRNRAAPRTPRPTKIARETSSRGRTGTF